MQVVIPAGGRGSRFGSSSLTTPKEMLLLGGKPLIRHALEEAARGGLEGAVVVVAPWKKSLIDHLAGTDLPLPTRVAVQPEPLGIGDAVLRSGLAPPFGLLLPDDVICTVEPWPSLLAASARDGAAALCLRSVPESQTHRFGIAAVEGEVVIDLVEKPAPGTARSNLAIFGRYVVTEAVLAAIAGPAGTGEIEITDAFGAAVSVPPGVVAVRYEGAIFDCGTPDAYRESMASFGVA